MKLVGATNWFVRGPFMLEGLLCGLVGSLAAVVLLFLGKEIGAAGDPRAHRLVERRQGARLHRHRADPDRRRARRRRARLRHDAAPLPQGLSARSESDPRRRAHPGGRSAPRRRRNCLGVARLRLRDAPQSPFASASATVPGRTARTRHRCVQARGREARRGPDRDPAPGAAAAARDRRRAPRADELRQDPRRARVPRRAGARRLRRPAADARAGGAPPARGRCSARSRSGSSPARSASTSTRRSLLHRRDGAGIG